MEQERSRVFLVVDGEGAVTWKEINAAIAKLMQNHCGTRKSETLLKSGLSELSDLRANDVPRLSCHNPHELVRSLEVLNVLTNAELVLHSCLARKASAKYLLFDRSDFPEKDPPEWNKFVTVRIEAGEVIEYHRPIDYYGDLQATYEAHNEDYITETGP